jgi:beta-glucanase (GH16 family)
MKLSKTKHFLLAIIVLVAILVTSVGVINASAAPICTPATAISVPFAKDGAGDFCYVATSLCGYINSWNMTTLEVNGTAYTNIWVAGNSIAPVNGTYTIHYVGPYAWSHFEIGGTCSGGATNTPPPAITNTPTKTNTLSGPTATRTNTVSGPTATRTRTPTLGGPTATRTPTPLGVTNTPTRTATRTNTPVTPLPTATLTGGFLDNLDSYNTGLFTKADGWTNGNPFNVGWRADHVNFSGGIMTLTLNNTPCPSGCSNMPYASGEYRTNNLYGYGLYEGRFKAAKASGTVTSLFTYTGPSDGQPWDEIDFEVLGKNTNQMQLNYFTNGTGGHETIINLGFDSSAGFHTYGFEYRPTYIKWFVDGVLVHTETGSRGPLPSHNMKLMVNFWPGIGVDGWLGPFTYTGPLSAQYEWLKYTP